MTQGRSRVPRLERRVAAGPTVASSAVRSADDACDSLLVHLGTFVLNDVIEAPSSRTEVPLARAPNGGARRFGVDGEDYRMLLRAG